MSEQPIQLRDRFYFAALEGGPYLVISPQHVRGFSTYGAAEDFAAQLQSENQGPVSLARAIFRKDGTPCRMKTFPTPSADSAFERARREFGL